eukprot:CAMPEP_0172469782 /NCGR_PEP_ID=MMETSP1065-20121228/64627_1 /TAXON_ID=265537 /ORGANISM="Amphiprora paludosa, Strain CCMP125" /LENGTH=38 /DNA_ID= /DNA_START= /DNA_END= /DNA_ORIENTATION=
MKIDDPDHDDLKKKKGKKKVSGAKKSTITPTSCNVGTR